MLISVIVCTYNPNDDNLARVLDSILNQDLRSEEWQVLVVDNNSSVPVKERKLIRDRQVMVEFEERQGLSAARECGLRHSQGDILVFVDDDNVLATDYLSSVKKIFEQPMIGIISGAIIPEYENAPPTWLVSFESMLAIRKPLNDGAYLTNIPLFNDFYPIGAGMAIKREIMENYCYAVRNGSSYISGRVGSELSSAEDLDLDFFAISQGFLVGTNGTLKIKHIIPKARTTIEYITRLIIASTKSIYEVNKKWENTFGEKVFSCFCISKLEVTLRLLICAVLFYKPRFRILYHYYKTLLSF